MLEYCSSVWNPYLLHDVDRLEKVQRAYTKRLTGLRDKSYKERLEVYQLISLELRRLHTDLILCYKIEKSLINLKFDDFFWRPKSPGSLRYDVMIRYDVIFCGTLVNSNA